MRLVGYSVCSAAFGAVGKRLLNQDATIAWAGDEEPASIAKCNSGGAIGISGCSMQWMMAQSHATRHVRNKAIAFSEIR